MAYDPERKVYVGELDRRGETIRFGIKEEDRSRHIYVIGQTGTGKSTLLEIMATQDVMNGEGLIFMDPHGQSVDNLLNFVPENRVDDTIYFAPHLQNRPIGLNIMEDIGYDKRHLVVSSLIASFHKIWGETSWSDRMEYILVNTLLALIEYPNTTLLDIGRMYSNKEFRNHVIENIKDPQVRKYWIEDYANYNERYVQDATPAIQNKLGQFTANPLIRNIIAQPKSSFNFREIMDNKKVLLVNLSKGQIGENNAKMLGVLFTTKIYLAALSRGDMTHQELTDAAPCNFYVDEFQSFANSSFAGILSEARKYKLNLVLAHQYIGQLYSDDAAEGNMIRDAVFGNVGTFVSFRVGPVDAEIIAKQFAPVITEEDLVALPRRHMFLTLNIDGAGSTPFSARTFQMPDPPPISLAELVIKKSGERYGVDQVALEEQIRERLEGTVVPSSGQRKPDEKNKRKYADQKGRKDGKSASAQQETQKPFQKVAKGLIQKLTGGGAKEKGFDKKDRSQKGAQARMRTDTAQKKNDSVSSTSVTMPASDVIERNNKEKKDIRSEQRERSDSNVHKDQSEERLNPAPEKDRKDDKKDRLKKQKDVAQKKNRDSDTEVSAHQKTTTGSLGGLIKSTQQSGLKKDLTVPPKPQEKKKPPIHYDDDWINLNDLQRAGNDGNTREDTV